MPMQFWRARSSEAAAPAIPSDDSPGVRGTIVFERTTKGVLLSMGIAVFKKCGSNVARRLNDVTKLPASRLIRVSGVNGLAIAAHHGRMMWLYACV